MRDVADRAGVSPMTVSRALRGESTVRSDLAERVLAAAKELDYHHNDWARGLRSGSRSGLVGLVVTNLANPYYAELATGVDSVISASSLQLLFGSSGDDGSAERRATDGLAARRVEGLIVVPTVGDDDFLVQLSQQLPVVTVGERLQDSAADSVTIDDFGGAREASRRLVFEGHDRIAFLGLSHASRTGSERERGFLAGQEECGVPSDNAMILKLSPDPAEADRQMWRLMSGPTPPTAVFAANNRNTIAACRWVAKSGEVLRIVGFDAIRTAELFQMPLSLVEYSAEELGARAGRLLLQRMDRSMAGNGDSEPSDAPKHEAIGTQLIDYDHARYGAVSPL